MEKRRIIIIAGLLVLMIANYTGLTGNENIRAIQFVRIFAIGLLSGGLLNEFFAMFRAKRK